jgi:DNA-directed RNA polymerase specialized sigma24 family protein
LKVASSLPSFEGDASALRSWVFTIARCRLIDHQRRVGAIDPVVLAAQPSTDDPEGEALAAVAERLPPSPGITNPFDSSDEQRARARLPAP